MSNENFTINTAHMSSQQIANVGRLLVKAEKLDWFKGIFNPMIQIGYNTTHGNTYMWSEDEQYSLFISDFDSTIKACYSCPYDGDETIRNASNDSDKMTKWAERLYNKSCKKDDN